MYLRQFRLLEFINPREDAATYPELPGAFKVCSICPFDDPRQAEILAAMASMEKSERAAFARGMSKLLKHAATGKPLHSQYDKKQCHEAHEFTYKGKLHTIWRIRTNDIRILFYYGEDRLVLLVDSFPKHKNTLTEKQKSHAESVVKRCIDATEIVLIREKK
jgi:hypothetical protein